MRQGAEMSEERLRVGDASLLLPQLQDADSGVYTCLVIFTPEKEEGSFELKVEGKRRKIGEGQCSLWSAFSHGRCTSPDN